MTLYEITETGLANYKENLKIAKESNSFDYSLIFNARKPARVENSVGFVHVYGALLRDSTPLDRALGNTDYAEIISDLETVIEGGAKSVVLIFDSPGGTVAGAIEAGRAIQALSVPSVAFVAGNACSAAYKLASAATYVVASESATVANIGSILVYLDATAAHAAMGISLGAFVNEGATLKSTGHLAAFTDEQRAFLQETINEAGTNFQNFVLSNRPALDRAVFNAGWFSGDKAKSLGLIDAIGSEADATALAANLAEAFSNDTLN